MKLNSEKTKYMLINFCKSYQFNTRLYIQNEILEQIHQTRLLGVVISDDLSWMQNTVLITKKANQRLIILRKLYELNISKPDMIQIYNLYIRSVLETSCVVWASSITQQEATMIEKVQKTALKIIYGNTYISYENAITMSGLLKLSDRRLKLTLTFSQKCIKNEKTKHMFPLNEIKKTHLTEKYKVIHANTNRMMFSATPQIARQLYEVEVK